MTSQAAATSGPVIHLSFWSWVNGIDKSVAVWNSTHPNIQVDLKTVPGGKQGTYPKMFAAVKAGNAPDLGQVEFDYLPNFVSQGAVEDISSYVPEAKAKFPSGLWSLVSPDGKADYAIPQDAGPMAFYYRKDVFAAAGITTPPATWADFAADAAKIHAHDPKQYIANIPTGNADWFAGLVWQAGGSWFSIKNNAWQVSINSPASQKVASFWQDLLDKKEVVAEGNWDAAWSADLSSGRVAGWVSAGWGGGTLSANVPKTAGKWAVSAMPQWTAGANTTGNWGGSTTAVLKGSKHAKEAAQFAEFLNSDPASVALLVSAGGLFPAANGWFSSAAHDTAVPFFGGQKIFGLIAKGEPPTTWQWGPTMPAVYTAMQDLTGKLNSGETLLQALATTQSATVADMKKQGYSVAG